MQHLYPLELSVDRLSVGPNKLNPEVSVFRPNRNAPEIAGVVIEVQKSQGEQFTR